MNITQTNIKLLTYQELQEVDGGNRAGNAFVGGVGGAATGARLGVIGGPWGIAGGAVAGALIVGAIGYYG